MCGFSGFLGFNSRDKNQALENLRRMNNLLEHRGPDSEGFWIDENRQIALGHKRLSILDLSDAGSQPMISRSGNYILAYNGEIYNHKNLRAKLTSEKKDIVWRGNSDTETLLECIDNWGLEKALSQVEGMFALALWSNRENRLYLARDRFGEKPLYYGWVGSGTSKSFIFSSELKSLRVHPEFDQKISRDSIALQMRLSCIPSPFSIYEGINKLEPGHLLQLSLKNEETKKICYWPIEEIFMDGLENPFEGDFEDAVETLHKLIANKVCDQMLSDVPLGAFLSGGVDSSSIVALMQNQSSKNVKTFTIGFDSDDYNEALHAKSIASHLGTDHTELYLTGKDAMDVIPSLPSIYDEPFSDSSQIPTFLVSKLAKQSVTVSLSGDGGDELFGGYNRYLFTKRFSKYLFNVPYAMRKMIFFAIRKTPSSMQEIAGKILEINSNVPNFSSKFRKIIDLLPAKDKEDLYLNLVSNWKNPQDLVPNSNEPKIFKSQLKTGLDSTSHMMLNDLLVYLPDDILTKVDRASMNVSLESRVPFLNHKIFEFASRLPLDFKIKNSETKHVLREVLYKYVPKSLIERPKVGFAVPIENWLRGDLKNWAFDLLEKRKIDKEGYLNSDLVHKVLLEHSEGKVNHDQKLWDILMFQSWLDNQK